MLCHKKKNSKGFQNFELNVENGNRCCWNYDGDTSKSTPGNVLISVMLTCYLIKHDRLVHPSIWPIIGTATILMFTRTNICNNVLTHSLEHIPVDIVDGLGSQYVSMTVLALVFMYILCYPCYPQNFEHTFVLYIHHSVHSLVKDIHDIASKIIICSPSAVSFALYPKCWCSACKPPIIAPGHTLRFRRSVSDSSRCRGECAILQVHLDAKRSTMNDSALQSNGTDSVSFIESLIQLPRAGLIIRLEPKRDSNLLWVFLRPRQEPPKTSTSIREVQCYRGTPAQY